MIYRKVDVLLAFIHEASEICWMFRLEAATSPWRSSRIQQGRSVLQSWICGFLSACAGANRLLFVTSVSSSACSDDHNPGNDTTLLWGSHESRQVKTFCKLESVTTVQGNIVKWHFSAGFSCLPQCEGQLTNATLIAEMVPTHIFYFSFY